MSKPKASIKDTVIFKTNKEEHPNIAAAYPDGHSLEFPAIVTADTDEDSEDQATNMTVFLDGRGSKPMAAVPHTSYADEGKSSWKKG